MRVCVTVCSFASAAFVSNYFAAIKCGKTPLYHLRKRERWARSTRTVRQNPSEPPQIPLTRRTRIWTT